MSGRPSFEQVRAIEDVYIRRYAGFHRGVSALVGADLAHDAVQEGFARALRRHRQFAGDGPLDAWIWRIVVRTALDLRRTRGTAADPAVDVAPPEPERDPELALPCAPCRRGGASSCSSATSPTSPTPRSRRRAG
ncbi:MAG: hypothetical protein ICV64_06075 [Thermoleophilia bacterium]|nr:hypothetical protein [Thermoleophilia bacterium]